jgi:hypothetical protein
MEGKMKETNNDQVPSDLVYGSIRQEILDQKKCQFQLFSMAVTVTAAILAYGAATHVGPLVYTAPMVLNLLALIIIIDKAISIQRKVGYLQIMEQEFSDRPWRWETHLDSFRSLRGVLWEPSSGEHRKHSYVTTIALMLTILNFLCASLCWFGPARSIAARQIGWLDALVFALLIASPCWGFFKWRSLVRGENSTTAIVAKWKEVIRRFDAKEHK